MVVHKFKKTIIETYSRETFFLPYKGEGLELSKAYSKSLQSREEYNWDERIKYRLEHGSDEYIKAFDRMTLFRDSKTWAMKVGKGVISNILPIVIRIG